MSCETLLDQADHHLEDEHSYRLCFFMEHQLEEFDASFQKLIWIMNRYLVVSYCFIDLVSYVFSFDNTLEVVVSNLLGILHNTPY